MSKKIKVLFVDDEPELRENVKYCLEGANYEVITAADGNEGLELYKKEMPDVVVSDIMMPNKNGIDFLQTIAQQNQDFCFILVTGHGDKHSAIKAVEYGAYRFIEKPFEMDELQQAISKGAEHLYLKKRNIELLEHLNVAYNMLIELNDVYFERTARAENDVLMNNQEQGVEDHQKKRELVQLILKTLRMEKNLGTIKEEIKILSSTPKKK
ncbi:MAG: response regulator [Oligoflexia bacterium]|nr:response regulator [Oligoflexia bacterium]